MFSVLVIATRNKNKVREFRELLADMRFEIRSLDDFGPIPEAIEDGATFEENAYKKALHTAKILGLPALADDSGLMVEALGGAPGVYSARYAGDKASDDDNCQKLLREMAGKTDRRAAFHCALSIAVPSGPALTYEARCEGLLLEEKRGANGFGYDPLFLFPEFGKTFAELDSAEKHRVSHRGKALAELKAEIDKVEKWLNMRLAEMMPPHPDHDQFMDNDWSEGKR
jgi:XTP/dITP diphosphohydrolase